ncbi:helix-turn-helix transcriptional regulator [Paenibacillus puldeungensis]|uniref:Helix-turn-helix transcriptional regulator n=1 Tax=Paenibacillus puldeungensis TaxID=696536 RepID=A0ABW3S406_9BACL
MYQITLRAARVNKGMTIDEVAKRAQKSPKTIAKYEEDSTNIPRSLFILLVNLYEVPEDMIFFGRESVFIGFDRGSKRKRKIS